MSTMNAEVYDALVDAGASEEKARAAAVAVAGHDELRHAVFSGFAQVDNEFKLLRQEIQNDMTALRNDLNAYMESLRSELTRDMESLRSELTRDMVTLRTDITAEFKLMRWMIVATFGAIFALFVRSLFFS